MQNDIVRYDPKKKVYSTRESTKTSGKISNKGRFPSSPLTSSSRDIKNHDRPPISFFY